MMAQRVSSPLERLSFVIPLLNQGGDATDVSTTSTESSETRGTSFGKLIKGLVVGAGTLVVGTGFSLTALELMATPESALADFSGVVYPHGHHHHSHDQLHHYDDQLRGSKGLGRKSWADYTQEMVDYVASKAYTGMATSPPLDPLVVGSFSHFPESKHSMLGALLPGEVNHWADVHWTIAFSQFMDTFGLQDDYVEDEEMLLRRFAHYRSMGAYIYDHNRRSIQYVESPDEVDYLYSLEMNRFADLSKADVQSMGLVDPNRMNRSKPPVPANIKEVEAEHQRSLMRPFFHEIPDEFTWKDAGCVQKVKNQLRCGSCWAFSAVEALESAVCVARQTKKGLIYYRDSSVSSVSVDFGPGPVSPDDDHHGDYSPSWTVSGDMPNLSEQQLVDCALKDGNHGCHGGMMEFAFQYVMENPSAELCEETSYDYTGEDGQCQEDKCTYEKNWKVISWNNVTRFSEASLQKSILTYGNIAISVEADHPMFMMYSGGVVHDGKAGKDDDDDDHSCGIKLDHGVAVVGWGNDEASGEPYWLVKNSWGPNWGEEGFIRLARDSGGMWGECGILMDASYPVVKSYTYEFH